MERGSSCARARSRSAPARHARRLTRQSLKKIVGRLKSAKAGIRETRARRGRIYIPQKAGAMVLVGCRSSKSLQRPKSLKSCRRESRPRASKKSRKANRHGSAKEARKTDKESALEDATDNETDEEREIFVVNEVTSERKVWNGNGRNEEDIKRKKSSKQMLAKPNSKEETMNAQNKSTNLLCDFMPKDVLKSQMTSFISDLLLHQH